MNKPISNLEYFSLMHEIHFLELLSFFNEFSVDFLAIAFINYRVYTQKHTQ